MAKPKVFTDAEIAKYRKVINEARVPGAYEPGKWMLSPLNRRQDVVNGSFPKMVRLRDITLRVTEQMSGVVATEEARRKFLAEIVAVGVPEVHTSTFKRGHTTQEMRAEVEVVKNVNPNCMVWYGEAGSAEDVETAAEAGYDGIEIWAAPWAEAAVIYAAGPYELAWEGKDWRSLKFPTSRAEQFDRVLRIIDAGHKYGVKVSAGINMLPYATEEYIREYCEQVQKAGGYEIMLYDGPGGTGPEACAYLISLVKSAAPKCLAGIHAHNMFDMAVATSVACARAGAEVIEVSVNGYCAASGQADLAPVTMALNALYGVETGIDLGGLTRLARIGEEFTGFKLAWNAPVVGTDVFNWGGMESIIQELEVDPLIHWCIEPSLVGNERKWNVTRDSGPFTMWDKLDLLGIEAEKDDIVPILQACLKQIQGQRSPITDDQVRKIAGEVKASRRQGAGAR